MTPFAPVALAIAAQMSAPPIISVLPDVSSISAANAAGVLQYCLSNKLVSSASTDIVLGGLMKRPGVAAAPDFAAGQSGQVLGIGGKNFSIGQAAGHLQSQACDRVLRQAKTLP